jgi:hypothetical protein
MFQITSRHLEALGAQQAAGFAARMAAHLRETSPEEVAGLDDGALLSLVERIRIIGKEWNIVGEPHVERLIELFVGYGELRQNPRPEWLDEIVTYPGRPGEQILRRIQDQLFFGGNS